MYTSGVRVLRVLLVKRTRVRSSVDRASVSGTEGSGSTSAGIGAQLYSRLESGITEDWAKIPPDTIRHDGGITSDFRVCPSLNREVGGGGISGGRGGIICALGFVAQLDRAFASGAKGREFESLRAHKYARFPIREAGFFLFQSIFGTLLEKRNDCAERYTPIFIWMNMASLAP